MIKNVPQWLRETHDLCISLFSYYLKKIVTKLARKKPFHFNHGNHCSFIFILFFFISTNATKVRKNFLFS